MRGNTNITVDNPPVNPYLAIITAVISVSTASIIVRYSNAPPETIAFYRVFFAGVILFLINPVKTIKIKKYLNLTTISITALAGFFLAVHFATWNASLNFTTVSNSVIIADSAPLFSMIAAHYFLHEKITKITLLAVAITLLGTTIIAFGDLSADPGYLKGDFLAFIAALSLAGYFVGGRFVRKFIDIIPYSVLVYLFASVFLLIYLIGMNIPIVDIEPQNWLFFTALAIVPTIGGHSLFLYALRYLKAYIVNLSVPGELVGASILAYLLFNEAPTSLFYPGGILILGGLVLAVMAEENSNKNNTKEHI